jgi:cell division protein ZapE
MQQGPLSRYRSWIEAGEIGFDPAQDRAVEKLQSLADRLAQRHDPGRRHRLNPFARKPEPLRGLYLHGRVGSGKTMLMDLFYASLDIPGKHRFHFQEFMAELHEAIDKARKRETRDAVPVAAAELAAGMRLLCLDELEINDIADAMVVGRLFEAFFAEDLTIVATSNTAPRDLYRGGLNRELFLPFIGLIEQRMEVYELDAARDYRLERLAGSDLYVTPADAGAKAALDRSWLKLTGRESGEPDTLIVKGRPLQVPQAAFGVARFGFADLCEQALGPQDYQRIAHRYHTVLIDDIPLLGPERQNAARRLTTLIDALYDNGVGLIASAAAEPDALYRGDRPENFARTTSRLMEMRSPAYLETRQRGARGRGAG